MKEEEFRRYLDESADVFPETAFERAIQIVQAQAWERGHESCTHSCVAYEGLGERCRNPYKTDEKETP